MYCEQVGFSFQCVQWLGRFQLKTKYYRLVYFSLPNLAKMIVFFALLSFNRLVYQKRVSDATADIDYYN